MRWDVMREMRWGGREMRMGLDGMGGGGMREGGVGREVDDDGIGWDGWG